MLLFTACSQTFTFTLSIFHVFDSIWSVCGSTWLEKERSLESMEKISSISVLLKRGLNCLCCCQCFPYVPYFLSLVDFLKPSKTVSLCNHSKLLRQQETYILLSSTHSDACSMRYSLINLPLKATLWLFGRMGSWRNVLLMCWNWGHTFGLRFPLHRDYEWWRKQFPGTRLNVCNL